MKVAVVGAVSVSTYTNNTGETKANLEVTADDVEFLTRVDNNTQNTPHEDYSQAPEVPQESNGYTDVTADFDSSELPF